MRSWIGCLLLIVLLSSCASEQVVSSAWIQKRKYRPGFFVAKNHLAHAAKAPESADFSYIEPLKPHIIVSPHPDKSVVPRSQSLTQRIVEGVEQGEITIGRQNHTLHVPQFIQKVTAPEPEQDYYEEQKAPVSRSGLVGMFSGVAGAASFICMFAIAALPFGWISILFIASLLLCLVGLVMSIRGLRDSYRFKRRGKVLSYIGLFTSATFLAIDLIIVFALLVAFVMLILPRI
ncbi:MAG: hypothetical protein KDC12_14630 [Flavobacteriales bacterium]|nr:hypothetical protein [Flavobacteriales bacterium]